MPVVTILNAKTQAVINPNADLPRIPVAGDFIRNGNMLLRTVWVVMVDGPGTNDRVHVGVAPFPLNGLPGL